MCNKAWVGPHFISRIISPDTGATSSTVVQCDWLLGWLSSWQPCMRHTFFFLAVWKCAVFKSNMCLTCKTSDLTLWVRSSYLAPFLEQGRVYTHVHIYIYLFIFISFYHLTELHLQFLPASSFCSSHLTLVKKKILFSFKSKWSDCSF